MNTKNKKIDSISGFFILLMLIFLLPDTIFYVFRLGNFSLSTMLSLFFLLSILRVEKISKKSVSLILLCVIFLGINILTGIFTDNTIVVSAKVIFSAYLIMVLLFISSCFAEKILVYTEHSIKKAVVYFYIFLTIIGLLSSLLIKFNVYDSKSMIFFSEPSAFALIYLPFFSFCLYYASGFRLILLCLTSFGIALLVQNLTMLAGICICFLFLKKVNILQIIFAIIVISVAIAVFDFAFDLTYYTARLNFGNSTNLSLLVYLSGAERAYLNLIYSHGLGIGFQQMGVNGILGDNQQILESLGAGELNLFDGSFILSKFISEFGFVGVLCSLIYVFYLLKLYFSFKISKQYTVYYILCYSFYISFFIPFFLRGAGYLNPYVFMLMTSLFLSIKLKNANV